MEIDLRKLDENEYQIREAVAKANKKIFDTHLTFGTWGNASQIDKERKFIFIKPSGVSFKKLTPEKIVKVSLDGFYKDPYKASVDTAIHLEIYKGFEKLGAVVHTHSEYATIFAQAKIPIPCLGTTHADYFPGEIPLIEELKMEELEKYTKNLGKKIVSFYKEKDLDPLKTPACLVASHGVFVFGEDVERAIENAIILEQIAKIAYKTILLSQNYGRHREIESELLKKHFSRKHGENKYYGQ